MQSESVITGRVQSGSLDVVGFGFTIDLDHHLPSSVVLSSFLAFPFVAAFLLHINSFAFSLARSRSFFFFLFLRRLFLFRRPRDHITAEREDLFAKPPENSLLPIKAAKDSRIRLVRILLFHTLANTDYTGTRPFPLRYTTLSLQLHPNASIPRLFDFESRIPQTINN